MLDGIDLFFIAVDFHGCRPLTKPCKKCRSMKDNYRILDLPVDASSEDVKARYRLLVRIFHPDRYPKPEDKAYAKQRLQEINEAYETIQGKQSRGLALAVDARPPIPIVSPREIDFGQVIYGERSHAQVEINNAGGLAQALNFRFDDGVKWVTVVKGKRLDPDQPLPMQLTLEAATESLAIGETYASWLDIDMNGAVARVPLRLHVVDQVGPSRKFNWLLAATLMLITVMVFYLGWTWIGAGEASSTTATVGTIEVDEPSVVVASGLANEAGQAADTKLDDAVASNQPSQDGVGSGASVRRVAAETTPQISAAAIITETESTDPSEATAIEPSVTVETATLEPTATATETAPATPTPTESATALPILAPTLRPIPTQTPNATPVAVSVPVLDPEEVVLLTVPQTFSVNARADTSVDSASLGLLPKGSSYRGIARTLDNAWTQIVLADGRVAWVFTEAMGTSLEQIATLPVSTTLLDVAAVAERPNLDVIVGPGTTNDAAAVEPEVTVALSPAAQTIDRQTHLVEAGEYLKQLALVYYGDEALWERIYAANLEVIGSDPDELEAGMELIIPAE